MSSIKRGLEKGLSLPEAYLLAVIEGTPCNVDLGGVPMIARTREEWCASTALTLDQYRRALTELKARGLIFTEQHKSKVHDMNNVTFLRSLDLLAHE